MKALFAATIVTLFAGGLMANDSGDASKIFPYKYEMRDLKNGLRVIVIPTDYPNIVALKIPVRTGSRNEVETGKSGFAHFFEHMMFRGTEKYPAEKYNEILKNAGADQNAWTSDDLTNYHITFSKDDLEKILEVEADRFRHLKYSVSAFKTEAKAVLGEYNKNSANPVRKLIEVQRNAAFREHTYKHTTMGFIEDIENMPNQYEYSLEFFQRYYRPENTVIILAGDLDPERTFELVQKYWGGWKPAKYETKIPAEPQPEGPVYEHVQWQTSTLPWVSVAFHGPAFSDRENDMTTMDLISQVAFSQSSPLYQKLVVDEQKVDQLWSYFPDRIDPYLLTVAARVKDIKDVWYIRDQILETFAQQRLEPVATKRLQEIKSNLKYSFAARMDNSEAIANALVEYVGRTRDPESVNRLYQIYDTIRPEDLLDKAREYFTDKRLVVVSLSQEELPAVASPTGSIDELVRAQTAPTPELTSILHKNDSPLINFRLLFNVGSAQDPPGKEGLAQLTANMVSDAGSQALSYTEIQQALYPLAASFSNQVDKEMTVFQGAAHKDNLNAYYDIISQQLLLPAWDEDDFSRVKTNLTNAIKVNLRENNDEELGKETLYEFIYRGHPYGHLNLGHVTALEQITLADVQAFYREHYTQANLVVGMAGDFTDSFTKKLNRDLSVLPKGEARVASLPEPPAIDGLEAEIIQKETRSTAVSFGFPIAVNRSHPDFAALWLVRSFLGEHRSTNSHLFQRIREIRGMNYGDYAYIEYFPRGMFQFYPDPNLGRQQQIFQIWIRPVETVENAHFATRVAMYELRKLIADGLTEEEFQTTRNYLLKFVHLLTKTQDRLLGYALDSRYYNTEAFTAAVTRNLNNLTLQEVNRAIRTHLQDKNVKFVFVTKDAEALRSRLIRNSPSPMTYQSEKPDELLQEDKIIQDYRLDFAPEKVTIRNVEEIFVNATY